MEKNNINKSETENLKSISLVEQNRIRNLSELEGNEEAKTLLLNQILYDKYYTVLIFEGPPGTAKTSTAQVYGRLVNCLTPNRLGELCGECPSCKSSESGDHPDIVYLNASLFNSIDTSKQLAELVKTKPRFKKKVFLLDEWHNFQPKALDALLTIFESASKSDKTVVPSDYMFILMSTEVPEEFKAVLSRAFPIKFSPLGPEALFKILKKAAYKDPLIKECPDEALYALVERCKFKVRDAFKYLTAAALRSHGKITLKDIETVLSVTDENFAQQLLGKLFSFDFNTIHKFIEKECSARAINANDFDNMFKIVSKKACYPGNTEFALFTDFLQIITESRDYFISRASSSPSDCLLTACRKMVNKLAIATPYIIVEKIAEYNQYQGELLRSLNPSCLINEKGCSLEIDFDINTLPEISKIFKDKHILDILTHWGIREYKFKNVASNLSRAIASISPEYSSIFRATNPAISRAEDGTFALIVSTTHNPELNHNFMNALQNNEVVSLLKSNYISTLYQRQ